MKQPDPNTGGVILECCKTGRWWPHKTEGLARSAARQLGLVDFIISEGSEL